ncbi:MAG: lytic murein transglycosylase [Gammaproteobacteria bacterium]|nr:MAG: lytic murein transglycosylase [Gammaproteobacteria bacterium]
MHSRCTYYSRSLPNRFRRVFNSLGSITACLVLSFFYVASAQAAAKQEPRKTKSQTPAANAQAAASVTAARKAERIYYMEAQKALDKKQFSRYRELLPNLRNYPLLPYLEYQELGDRLMGLPTKEVEQFFNRYPNSYVGERLRHRWLRVLAIKELWKEYLRFYDKDLTDPELACLNLRAKLATGDKTALKGVESLWNVAKEQPAACDPVFSEWKRAGYLTQQLMWDRHLKAVKADAISLAVNLAKEMTPEQQVQAVLYENVAQNPRLILQPENFKEQTPETRATIALGLEKYAETDAEETATLWNIYASRTDFTQDERLNITYTIARQLLRQDHGKEAEKLVVANPNLSRPDLMEALIREALKQKDWEKAYRWILRLPADSKKTERWTYWQGRIMEQLKIAELEGKKPKDFYENVAATRSFYGFLASDKLGISYSLLDKPLTISKELMNKVEFDPGIQRAREYFLLGNLPSANREWTYTTNHLPSTEEMVAAGRLADRWGWYRQAIQTMQDSDYWDDLSVRFPIPYHEQVKAAVRETSIDPHFIFAIAKQESAFNTDATSPVGALGLMQLMPTTAKQTAKKAGLLFRPQDLLQADKNIHLGSRYLDELLGAFSGNRILASAAYNAGPGRVRQWLNSDDSKLPYDVWIETIPYKETRFYVQNVLSFAVIYAYRTGTRQPFITPQEAAREL